MNTYYYGLTALLFSIVTATIGLSIPFWQEAVQLIVLIITSGFSFITGCFIGRAFYA